MADFGVSSVIRETLVGDRLGLDAKSTPRSVIRETVVGDRLGLDSKTLVRGLVREVIASEKPSFGIARVFAEYLIKQPALVLPSIIREVLTDGYTASVIIEQVAGAVNLASQSLPMPPISEVISVMQSRQVGQNVTQAYLQNEFPWSLTRSAQSSLKVVSARVEGLPISFTTAASVINLAACRLPVPRPDDVYSRTTTSQLVSLVVISTEIPYVPPIGAYVPLVRQRVVQAYVEPLPLSYSRGAQVVSSVVQAAVEPLPISEVSGAQVSNLAVSAADYDMPRSSVYTAQVVNRVVQTWQGPDPRVGEVGVASYVTLAVQASDIPAFVGSVISGQSVVKAVQAADYPPPSGLVALMAPQVTSQAVSGSDYATPGDVQSQSAYAFANTMFTQLAPSAFYPDPDGMYVDAANSFTAQVVEVVTQRRLLPWVYSMTPVAQLSQKAVQATYYPPPDELLDRGVTAKLVAEQVAQVADYPSAVLPDSDGLVSLAMQQVAQVSTYPPPTGVYAQARVTLAMQQSMQQAAYADKGTIYSTLKTSLAVGQVLQSATYRDKDDILSYAVASQVAQSVAQAAVYLSKDSPQSRAVVMAAVGQVAQVAGYAPPSQVGSAAVATEVVAQVLSRDLSLYGFPPPPRRRRPVILTRYVW